MAGGGGGGQFSRRKQILVTSILRFYLTVNTDRMANSADPNQNYSMLKSHCSIFMVCLFSGFICYIFQIKLLPCRSL